MQSNTLKLLEPIKKDTEIIKLDQLDISGFVNLTNYYNLRILSLCDNTIQGLIGLSDTIIEINCSKNNLICFGENLPLSLKKLDCSRNSLKNLPILPNSLDILICSYNQIENLNNLPSKISKLDCSHNKIILLENLPNSLEELNCSHNNLTNLDWLPESLKILNCIQNDNLKNLDNLPNSLEKILIPYDIDLKILPKNLKELYCPDKNKCVKIKNKKLY